jgi:hypothetical protein
MGNAADIQFSFRAQHRDHLGYGIRGGKIVGFPYQINEKVLLHDITVHEDIVFLGIASVLGQGGDVFVLVETDHAAAEEMILRIVHLVVKHGDVCAGFNMSFQQFVIILGVDHIARFNDHIIRAHALDIVHVVQKTRDIGIVQFVRAGLAVV